MGGSEEMSVEAVDHPPCRHSIAPAGERPVVMDGLGTARAELPAAAALNGRLLERVQQLEFVHDVGDVRIGSGERDGGGRAKQGSENDKHENKAGRHDGEFGEGITLRRSRFSRSRGSSKRKSNQSSLLIVRGLVVNKQAASSMFKDNPASARA